MKRNPSNTCKVCGAFKNWRFLGIDLARKLRQYECRDCGNRLTLAASRRACTRWRQGSINPDKPPAW